MKNMNTFPFSPDLLKCIDRVSLAKSLIESQQYTRFILGYLPEWRPFFLERADELATLEKELCLGLDDESRFVVHRVIRYYQLLLLTEDAAQKRLDRYDMLVNGSFFLSTNERQIMQLVAAEQPLPWETENGADYWRNIVFPKDKAPMLDMCSMRLDFGLQFLPRNSIDLRDKDVIDGGGFIGHSSLAFCRYQSRKVYCFEPNPTSISLLEETLGLNGRNDNVQVVPKALGKENGTFAFYTNVEPDFGAGFRVQETKDAIEVSCATIDRFVEENNLRPGLIKLDVEGSEQDVIAGAVETIRRFKPILLIAVNHRAHDFFDIKPFLERMNLDYRFMFRSTSFSNPNDEICLIAHVE